jgi:hypothetical protein
MTIKVKDWNKFQHFKDRKPPWIKLYRDLLDDLEWHELDPVAAKALVAIWLIASENDGELPEMKKLAFRLRVTEKQAISIVSQLDHWLIQDDINVISDRYQSDSLEIEEETYREETENKKLISSKKPRVTSSAEFDKFWMIYPRKVNKGLAMKAWEKAASKAAPALIIAAVEAWKVSKDFPEPDFIPHPSSWLTGERWSDELSDKKQVVTQAEREAFMAEHRRKMMELSNDGIEPVGSGSLNLHEDDSIRSEIPWI